MLSSSSSLVCPPCRPSFTKPVVRHRPLYIARRPSPKTVSPPLSVRLHCPLAFNKLTDVSTTPAGLVAASLPVALCLLVDVSVGAIISGGHVHPAFTIIVGSFFTFFAAGVTLAPILATLAVGSLVAGAFLFSIAGAALAFGLAATAFRILGATVALSSSVRVWNAVVLEIVMTFVC